MAPAPTPSSQEPLFDVRAYLPSKGASADGWSLIAAGVPFSVALTYKQTCLFKINCQPHKEP